MFIMGGLPLHPRDFREAGRCGRRQAVGASRVCFLALSLSQQRRACRDGAEPCLAREFSAMCKETN